MPTAPSFSLIRDARLHHALLPNVRAEGAFRGRVTRTTGRGKVMFVMIRDVTESIQVLVEQSAVTDEVWEAFKSLHAGDGVVVRGTVGSARNGTLSLFPSVPPDPLLPLGLRELLEQDLGGVGTALLLARLEQAARNLLVQAGCIEMSARLLSSVWPAEGLQALHVLFPGQSRVPLYLAVSPNVQLLRALLASGQSRIFCVSRAFATNIVATQNGAESVLATAHLLGEPIESAAATSIGVLRALLSGIHTGVDLALQQSLCDTPVHQTTGDTLAGPAPDGSLGLHLCRCDPPLDGPGGFPVVAAFRVQWRHFVLAEGYASEFQDNVCYSSMTIHLERLLSLLRAGDNRRINDLSQPDPVSHA